MEGGDPVHRRQRRARRWQIETTALAVLAWLREPARVGNVERSMRFLAESCEGGRYGSTQSTVLALRAIVAYDQARSREAGSRLGCASTSTASRWASAVKFDRPDAGGAQAAGRGRAARRGRAEDRAADGRWGSDCPTRSRSPTTPSCRPARQSTQVDLEVALAKNALTEGEPTEARVWVTNRSRREAAHHGGDLRRAGWARGRGTTSSRSW